MAIRGVHPQFQNKMNKDHMQIILDTEGLQSIEREKDDECLFNRNFDRAMVTFCFAISHVVIINIKGDIDPATRNLIGICGWVLQKLNLPKCQKPKIQVVLNQQADPDTENHRKTLQSVIEQLNEEYGLAKEDKSFQDILDLKQDNFFILPTAFKIENLNGATS